MVVWPRAKSTSFRYTIPIIPFHCPVSGSRFPEYPLGGRTKVVVKLRAPLNSWSKFSIHHVPCLAATFRFLPFSTLPTLVHAVDNFYQAQHCEVKANWLHCGWWLVELRSGRGSKDPHKGLNLLMTIIVIEIDKAHCIALTIMTIIVSAMQWALSISINNVIVLDKTRELCKITIQLTSRYYICKLVSWLCLYFVVTLI